MDGLKKAYYGTYQQVFDIGMRCLHWRKPIVFSGAGCLKQVPDVLGKCGVEKVMVVTGSQVVMSLSLLWVTLRCNWTRFALAVRPHTCASR